MTNISGNIRKICKQRTIHKWKEKGKRIAALLRAVMYWSVLLWGQDGCRMIHPVVTQPFTAVTQHQASHTAYTHIYHTAYAHKPSDSSRVEVYWCWWASEVWYSTVVWFSSLFLRSHNTSLTEHADPETRHKQMQ